MEKTGFERHFSILHPGSCLVLGIRSYSPPCNALPNTFTGNQEIGGGCSDCRYRGHAIRSFWRSVRIALVDLLHCTNAIDRFFTAYRFFNDDARDRGIHCTGVSVGARYSHSVFSVLRLEGIHAVSSHSVAARIARC